MRKAVAYILLIFIALAGTAARAAAESESYESEAATNALEKAGRQLADHEYASAAGLLGEALATGPDSVVRGTELGVGPTVRRMIFALAAQERHDWSAAVGPAAEEAWRTGLAAGTTEALAEVSRRYPGTAAARRAEARLWAAALEAGEFRRAMEWIGVSLEDPDLTPGERRMALVNLALAASQAKDAAAAERAVAGLQALGSDEQVKILSRQVSAEAWAGEMLAAARAAKTGWENVGGNPERTGAAAAAPKFGGLMVLGQNEDRENAAAWRSEAGPTRRELLAVRGPVLRADVSLQAGALVTGRSIVATVGGELQCYDRFSGEPLWTDTLPEPNVAGGAASWPSCGEGRVALIRGSKVVRAGGTGGGQVMINGMMVFIGNQGYNVQNQNRRELVVLDELTGAQVWSLSEVELQGEARAGSVGLNPSPGPKGPSSPKGEGLRNGNDQHGSPEAGTGTAVGPMPAAKPKLVFVGAPLIYGGRVFVGAIHDLGQGTMLVESYLVCLDLADGAVLWERFLGSGAMPTLAAASANGQAMQPATTALRSVPTTDGQRIYVESPVGTVAAVDLATADVAWIRKLAAAAGAEGGEGSGAAGRGPYGGGITLPASPVDAPTVAGDRLIVTNVRAGQMVCLGLEDGRAIWETEVAPESRRIGVAGGKVWLSGVRTVRGYDLATGRESVTAALEADVSGRGFATAEGLYLPTTAGVVRIDAASGRAATVAGRQEGADVARGLAPADEGVICAGDRQVSIIGPVASYLAQARREEAENPTDPVWPRRVGELLRQSGDLAGAETAFNRALGVAARLTDPERARDEELAAYKALGRLYLEWAERLAASGRGAETESAAAAKFEKAVDLATSPATKAAALLARARLREKMGRTVEAQADYAHVAAEEQANRLIVAGRDARFDHTLAAEATAALWRLRGGSEVGAARGLGLRRDELGRLEARQVALKAWCPGSSMKVDEVGALAPLVWVRPDGLAAFGADGTLRWRYHEETGAGPIVLTKDKEVYVRSERDILAIDAETGTESWSWQPAEGRVLTGQSMGRLAAVFGVNFQQRLKNAPANISGLVRGQTDQWDADTFVVSDSHVLVTSATRELTGQKLQAINRKTGKEDWTLAAPEGWAVDAVLTDAGRVTVVLRTTPNSQGSMTLRLELRCFDEAGRLLWTCEMPPGASSMLAQPLRYWAGQGMVVVMEGMASCIFADGKCLRVQEFKWPASREAKPEVRVVAATADEIIFWTGAGFDAWWRAGGQPSWFAEVGDADSKPRAKTVRMVQGNGVVMVTTFQGGAVPPFVSEKTVAVMGERLVAQTAGAVCSYDLKTGAVMWRHEIGDAANGEGAADDGAVLACGDMAAVFCHREGRGELWFLDAASGKLLETFDLGTCGDGCGASLVRGGVFVDLGDEMVVVRGEEGKS
jgi:outer membrane protein assembly factor BamB